jgi:hypothetical protein
MYQEQPDPRNFGTLTDNSTIEYFQYREDENQAWISEAQYTENVTPDEEFPEGIAVYWMTYSDINTVLAMDTDQFKAASFPRKPGKRGGSPAGV